MALHESAEMYLETIYELSLTHPTVRSIDVAEAMGYSSPQQFSRQFHSICGITPTQYIRSLR
mgnify:CR=1 FL=1